MSRSNVHVRPAEAADVPALIDLATLIKQSGKQLSGRSSIGEGSERAERLTTRFNAILDSDRRTVLAAFGDADLLLGFVVVLEDELAPMDPTPVLHVSHLALRPNSTMHDAAGNALLGAVVRLAEEREIDHVLATATTSSREANRFLARLGFAPFVIRRIATTSSIRRGLGIAEVPDRVAARRRLLAGRAGRPIRRSAAARALTRGV